MMSCEERPGVIWHRRQGRAEALRRGKSDA
nr:MAG TPA: hypothetical protein [Caudoviricetes sp.]